MPSAARTLVLFTSALTAVNALNDWNTPCLEATCSFDLPGDEGSATGALKIWSSNADAIADITTAADYEIIGCDPKALEQEIKVVCKTEDSEKCANLFNGGGPEGKVARLPSDCGANAFAHISRSWDPVDQTIPADVAAKLTRRDGVAPIVKGLAIDTNFASADAQKFGAVKFAVQGANIQGAGVEAAAARRALMERGFGDFFKGVINTVEAGLDKIGDGVQKATKFVDDAVKSLNELNVNDEVTFPPITFDESKNLFSQSVKCGPVDGKVSVDVAAKAKAVVTVGVAAAGTIIPPQFEDFALTTTLDAELNGSLDLKASASGSLDSGKITIFEVGIPGLDFPGIISIGPSFKVDGQATAKLDLNVDMNVGINYKINKAKFVLPPRDDDISSAFSIGETPLKLSASPNVKATGTVAAHVIPSLNLGLNAIGGIAKANAFINLDASANAALTLEAAASAAVTVDPTPANAVEAAPADANADAAAPAADATPAADAAADPAPAAKRHALSRLAQREVQVTPETSASFGGCFDIFAKLDVGVGVEGKFFGFFDENFKKSIFSKQFDLFKKCFGDKARRALPGLLASTDYQTGTRMVKVSRATKMFNSKRELACPLGGVNAASSVVDSTNALA